MESIKLIYLRTKKVFWSLKTKIPYINIMTSSVIWGWCNTVRMIVPNSLEPGTEIQVSACLSARPDSFLSRVRSDSKMLPRYLNRKNAKFYWTISANLWFFFHKTRPNQLENTLKSYLNKTTKIYRDTSR